MIQLRALHVYVIFGLIASIWLIDRLSGILLPFVTGFALAYFLDPLADRLEAVGIRRALATTVITAFFAVVLLVLIWVGGPLLSEQIILLMRSLPQGVAEINRWLYELTGNQIFSTNAQDLAAQYSDKALQLAGLATGNLLKSGLSFLNLVALIFITPIVTIYLLNDWDRMVAVIDRNLPEPYGATVRQLAHEIDIILSGFLRGQMIVCLSLGLIYALGLGLVGLKGGVLVGLLAGLVSFIPYVGSAFGVLLATALGLGQFGMDYVILGQMAAIFLVGQFIEGNFLTPRLVGDRVNLHPVWIIFALLAMGTLFGFLGLLLAVPIAAVIGVLVRFAFMRLLNDETAMVEKD